MSNLAFGVRVCVLSDGQRIPLIYDRRTSLPLDVPTRFGLALRWQGGSASSTAEHELRSIAYFLDWIERRGIDLDERLGTGRFFTNPEIEGLCDVLRESQRAKPADNDNVAWVGLSPGSKKLAKAERRAPVIGNETWYQRIKHVEGYVAWLMDEMISHLPATDPRANAMRKRRDDVVKKFESQLPDTQQGVREGLKPEEREDLLDIVDPESPRNPYQRDSRFRNYVMLRLYFEIGCRQAEALVLYTTDFVPGAKPMLRIQRRPNNPLDPRTDLPLVKTLPRDIPLSSEFAALLERYILSDRKKRPGSKKMPFLFLARNGDPIAARTVSDFTLLIRKHHPQFVGRLSTHVLRHDWNERFTALAKELGMSDEAATRHANYLMGWSKTSTQRARYTQAATRDEAQQTGLKLQKKSWGKKNDE